MPSLARRIVPSLAAFALAPGARDVEANWEGVFASGLWGVPSFRLLGDGRGPAFCTWGQDRIWRVEQEIRRRVGAPTH